MEYETKAYAIRFAREVAVEKVPCTHVNRAPSLYNNSWRTNDQIKERCRVGWCQIVCVLLFPFSLFRQNNGVKHKTFFNGTLVTKERFRHILKILLVYSYVEPNTRASFQKYLSFLSSHQCYQVICYSQLQCSFSWTTGVILVCCCFLCNYS